MRVPKEREESGAGGVLFMKAKHADHVSGQDQTLVVEIRTYENEQAAFEQHHYGKFVVIHDTNILGFFDDFDRAAREAHKTLGAHPFLIRRIGASTVIDPGTALHISTTR